MQQLRRRGSAAGSQRGSYHSLGASWRAASRTLYTKGVSKQVLCQLLARALGYSP